MTKAGAGPRLSSGETKLLDAEVYDRAILNPSVRRIFRGADYYNVGYWRDLGERGDIVGACAALIDRQLGEDPPEAARACRVVVDVGCGLGAGTARIASHYPDAATYGVNYSVNQVRHARRHHSGDAAFLVMDATRLAFADRSVDRIHSIEAAMHFRSRLAFLVEAERILRPGGRLILTDMVVTAPNNVVPPSNVTPSTEAYLSVCRGAGFSVAGWFDLTKDTILPFRAYLEASKLANLSRFFAGMVDRYLLVVLEKRPNPP